MADLTTTFDSLLKQREAPPTKRFGTNTADEFLKEAYRISSLITELHVELRNLRQAYLSTAAPRRTHLHVGKCTAPSRPTHLTDRDREEIDARAKMTLRDLNARIRALEDAEQLRQSTETVLIQKKYARGLGALGSWAAGGGALGIKKTGEQVAAEAAALQLGAHREGVMLFLRERLREAAGTQQHMMETRLRREVEKNRSVLAKARGPIAPAPGFLRETNDWSTRGSSSLAVEEDDEKRRPVVTQDLTEDQRQMFEKGNQDMLKHFESALDKVRTAEQSLIEIAELQNVLVGNLATQSAHIDQLVAESFETTEGVGKGNKELQKSTERSSMAQYTFYAATGLCAMLVVWDLII
ncbi:hypothetical protein B0H66DRAFT_532542 [Apodospora peruviana]|uniref:Syntaxin 18 n=1 Tax=Apodospora peruviana TaxID=516989 RepID=A0AAE0M3T5_9PEZI|nr:hypothetical protein B0H66DRAFT_532542 [Apodospora peruviana]